jgi:hypothetical protein
MAEERIQLELYKIEYMCDSSSCNGVMRPVKYKYSHESQLASKHVHQCTICRVEKSFDKIYPIMC